MKKTIILTITILILLYSCTTTQNWYDKQKDQIKNSIYMQPNNITQININPEIGEFKTEDNKTIAYTYYKNKNAKYGIILIHMLDRTRHDFDDFAKLLQTAGYSALTIDLRGHGNSTKNWRWRTFSERDLRMMTLDVKAASNFLTSKNTTNIILIGASIGANTALNYGITDQKIKALILMSPGLDYRGVKINDAENKNDKPTLLISSQDDLYAWTTSKEIYDKTKNKIKDYQYYQQAGHGTDIFKKEKADLLIIDWLLTNNFK